MKVRDIMTTDPVKVTGNTHLKEAARLMVRHRVSGLPVVDEGGKLIGILSEGDFIRREAGRDRPHGVSLLDAVFGEGELQPVGAETVAEIMTRSVVTITPEATVGEAARVMGRRSVKRLPVVDLEGRADRHRQPGRRRGRLHQARRRHRGRGARGPHPPPPLPRSRTGARSRSDDGVVTLEGELENRTEAHLLEELSRRIAGVVRVESRLRYKVDDRKLERNYPLP